MSRTLIDWICPRRLLIAQGVQEGSLAGRATRLDFRFARSWSLDTDLLSISLAGFVGRRDLLLQTCNYNSLAKTFHDGCSVRATWIKQYGHL